MIDNLRGLIVNRNEMQSRIEDLAVRVAKVAEALPKQVAGKVWGQQLIRAGSSIGANYHEAVHASSKKHFITTLEIAQRECNETIYWLRLIGRAELLPLKRLQPLLDECNEIYSILTASIRTAKSRK